MKLTPLLLARRSLFYSVFSIGITVGLGLSFVAYSLSFELTYRVLSWVFPQYVVLHPIDYAGPLPDAATIILCVIVVVAYFVSLREPNRQFAEAFQVTRQSVDQGKLTPSIPKIFVMMGLYGLYVGYFAWAVAAVFINFVL